MPYDWKQNEPHAPKAEPEMCACCDEQSAAQGSELCAGCEQTIDWPKPGRELPAGAELEAGVRTPGGGLGFAEWTTDYRRGER